MGHTSGVFHADYYLKGDPYDYMFMRLEGMALAPESLPSGKTNIVGKNEKKLTWKFRAASSGTEATLTIDNVVLEAWRQARGRSDLHLSKKGKKSFKSLVKTITGGKYTYAKAAKLSKSKAGKPGRKAIYRYVNAKVVPHVALRC